MRLCRSGFFLSSSGIRLLLRPALDSTLCRSSTDKSTFSSSLKFRRNMGSMSETEKTITPSKRVSGQRQDVWSIMNEAAATSPIQPIVNMGQGFFGYNPPQYVLDAAKEAVDRVDCNQYAPTKGRPRLRKAIADAYSPFFKRELNPETEIVITSGANEGMLSAFMAFITPGDEVIVIEPFFDQYLPNIEMAGGVIRYVPLHPPSNGGETTTSAGDWTLNPADLAAAITPRTKILVLNTPHNPIGKIFTEAELDAIATLCTQHNILILSDEVYDRLYYKPLHRIATLTPSTYARTLTVGSCGKNFFATGWRVGYLIGPPSLIAPVAAAHTRICYSSVSPLQEACAIGFEDAEKHGFWDSSVADMKRKIACFVAVLDELGIPYSAPEGGYFVLANFKKLKLPDGYAFPESVKARARDFRVAWWLTMEHGVAAIPPTEFVREERREEVQDWLRFAVCKDEDVLEEAKRRLRGIKEFLE